ncbi:MAG: hypothetical protein ACK4K7_11970 [Allosphingosinicella sp.]
MHCEQHDHELDLGTASVVTRGGMEGAEDYERTKWLHGSGLSDD